MEARARLLGAVELEAGEGRQPGVAAGEGDASAQRRCQRKNGGSGNGSHGSVDTAWKNGGSGNDGHGSVDGVMDPVAARAVG